VAPCRRIVPPRSGRLLGRSRERKPVTEVAKFFGLLLLLADVTDLSDSQDQAWRRLLWWK